MDKSIVSKAKGGAIALNTNIVEAITRQSSGFIAAVPADKELGKRFFRLCITAVKENPALQQCSVQSLLGSFMVSAHLGLQPNNTLAEAHIIPYGNKAQFQIGYRGLLKLAWNSGLIISIDFDKICENDKYEYTKGDGGKLTHTPLLSGDRGKTIAYYAIALMKTGGSAVHLMTLQEVQEHGMRFSKAYNAKASPWKTAFDSMAYKTVLRQLADKKLPKATQSEAMMKLLQAVQKDSTTNYIPEDKIGVSIDMDEIIDDTEFGEVDKEVHEHPMGAGFANKDAKVDVNIETGEILEEKPVFVPQSKQEEIPT